MSIEFTGEFFVPGKSGERIELDHFERYKFACRFVHGRSVLDIACGVGYAAPLLMAAGAIKYSGVDINRNLIHNANETYGSDKIKYHESDIVTFDNNEKYDVIICYETIEHIRNYGPAVDNLCKLLKSGGKLLISSPNRPITSPHCSSLQDKPKNDFHTQEFTPSELISIIAGHGLLTDQYPVYGQRQRYSNRVVRRISKILLSDPNERTSPVPSPIHRLKIPRYFVVIAVKP